MELTDGLGVKMGECGSRNLIVRVTRGMQDLQSFLLLFFFRILECVYHTMEEGINQSGIS